MERKFLYLIILGLIIESIFGVSFGAALENTILGVAFGALAGVFIGWFAAAANEPKAAMSQKKVV